MQISFFMHNIAFHHLASPSTFLNEDHVKRPLTVAYFLITMFMPSSLFDAAAASSKPYKPYAYLSDTSPASRPAAASYFVHGITSTTSPSPLTPVIARWENHNGKIHISISPYRIPFSKPAWYRCIVHYYTAYFVLSWPVQKRQ